MKYVLLPIAMMFASAVYATDVNGRTSISVAAKESFTADSGTAHLTRALLIREGSTFNLSGASISIGEGCGTLFIESGGTFNMTEGSYTTADLTRVSTGKLNTNEELNPLLLNTTFNISGGYYNSGAAINLLGGSSFNLTDTGIANKVEPDYNTWVYTGSIYLRYGASLNITGQDLYFSCYNISVYGGSSVNIEGSGGIAVVANKSHYANTSFHSYAGETSSYSVIASGGDYSVVLGNIYANGGSLEGVGFVQLSFTGTPDYNITATAGSMILGNPNGVGAVDLSLNGYTSLSSTYIGKTNYRVPDSITVYSGTTISLNNANNFLSFLGSIAIYSRATVAVNGTANTASFTDAIMYEGSTLKVVGSSNTVGFSSSVDFQSNAIISFVADAAAFSPIALPAATDIASIIIQVDLSAIAWSEDADVSYALFTSNSLDFSENDTFADATIVASSNGIPVGLTTAYWRDSAGNYIWGITSIGETAVP